MEIADDVWKGEKVGKKTPSSCRSISITDKVHGNNDGI